ncbi:Hepatocellular carcinoma-associated antigen 59 [Penicillium lagena]|uniref:Hepatocellular carcinoma-associated antigen 59 n=1 Tax=Penicillium lagena TaxID=94218 RepID=UPI00254154E6|nr:Hepatocellular carcinoma-associated antigen 59 [Penicillium lagena]KAJ5605862.1 Hepatocellular carcinoma-associated antigen 59 [Penicillium lagena]
MDADATSEPLFRPMKRRKFARRRPDHESDDIASHSPAIDDDRAPESPPEADYSQQHITGPLRRPRPRKGGIEFSTARPGADGSRQSRLVPAEDPENERLQAMGDRFTGYTGQTVDVDKHMYGPSFAVALGAREMWTNEIRMAYIESELAKRAQRKSGADSSTVGPPIAEGSAGGTIPEQQQREPASLGKLHEIDLGQEIKLQNIARTEAATRRLAGDDDIAATKVQQPDHEIKRWRHRKRRTSADIERDRLVEEVLRESKLDVYDEPEEEGLGDDQAADDRIAEQFRRDFLDAIQSRRRVRTTKPTSATEAPKGPKLGGSRSARAAMREAQTKR